jgi:hypothetical protein
MENEVDNTMVYFMSCPENTQCKKYGYLVIGNGEWGVGSGEWGVGNYSRGDAKAQRNIEFSFLLCVSAPLREIL